MILKSPATSLHSTVYSPIPAQWSLMLSSFLSFWPSLLFLCVLISCLRLTHSHLCTGLECCAFDPEAWRQHIHKQEWKKKTYTYQNFAMHIGYRTRPYQSIVVFTNPLSHTCIHYTWPKWCIAYYLWAVHEQMLWQLWFGKGSFDAVWLRAPCAGMFYSEWIGTDRTGQTHHPLWSSDSEGFSLCICCGDVYLFLCGGVVMDFLLCSLVTPMLSHKQQLNYKSVGLHYNETHPHPLYRRHCIL